MEPAQPTERYLEHMPIEPRPDWCVGRVGVPYDLLFQALENVTDYSVRDIRSAWRRRAVVRARKVFGCITRLHGATYTEIGELIHRDHTTVMDNIASAIDQIRFEAAPHIEVKPLTTLLINVWAECQVLDPEQPKEENHD